MLPMHVFLIGMTGSGKTSLGRKAAGDLGLPFLETDQLVSEMLGRSILDIYATLGEEFIRNAESGVLMDLVGVPPSIVSTGNGLPTTRENVQLMQNHGVIVHIDRPLDQILSDAMSDRNPARPQASREDIVLEYNQSIGFYHACADYTIENSHGLSLGVAMLTQLIESL